jgi:hypothetical protein
VEAVMWSHLLLEIVEVGAAQVLQRSVEPKERALGRRLVRASNSVSAEPVFVFKIVVTIVVIYVVHQVAPFRCEFLMFLLEQASHLLVPLFPIVWKWANSLPFN